MRDGRTFNSLDESTIMLTGVPLRTKINSILVILCLVITWVSPTPAAAAAPKSAPPQVAGDYLLVYPSTEELSRQHQPASIPAVDPQPVKLVVENDLAPIDDALMDLQSSTDLARYQVTADHLGVRISGLTPKGFQVLSALQGVRLIDLAQQPDCASVSAPALIDPLALADQADTGAPLGDLSAQSAAGAGSLQVTVQPGTGWSEVSGKVGSNLPVVLTLTLSNGTVTRLTTVSAADGSYKFFPTKSHNGSRGNCAAPNSPYSWSVNPGEKVEVTTSAGVLTTLAASISATLDPEDNQIQGKTTPGSKLVIDLDMDRSNCASQKVQQTLTAGSDGTFKASWADFSALAQASIQVFDAAGNTTRTVIDALSLSADLDYTGFLATISPNSGFTAALLRSGSQLASVSGTAASDGTAQGVFDSQVYQTGDQVTLSSSGLNATVVIAPLTVTLSALADQLSGSTSAGLKVHALLSHTRDDVLQNSCSEQSACLSGAANASGTFSFVAGMDVLQGDSALVSLYDAQGNGQFALVHAPVVVIDTHPYSSFFSGYASRANANIRFRELHSYPDGAFYTFTENALSDGYFSFPTEGNFQVNDYVEIKNMDTGETVAAQFLGGSTQLDDVTRHLTGWSPGTQRVIASLSDVRPAENRTVVSCKEVASTADHYDFDESDMQVGAADTADVFFRLSSGNYLHGYTYPFQVIAGSDSYGTNNIYGYTINSYEKVSLTLKDSHGAVLEKKDTYSDIHGSYALDPTSVVMGPGMQIDVLTDKGSHALLTIPTMTVTPDPAANRYRGTLTPNHALNLQIQKESSGDWLPVILWGKADAAGAFNLSTAGAAFRWCETVIPGDPCYATTLIDYQAGEHQVTLYTPEGTVHPDSYEPDDTFDSAKPYTQYSIHTIRGQDGTSSDTDMISFTVSPAQIGQTFHLVAHTGEGPALFLKMSLYSYAANVPTLLVSKDNGNYFTSINIDWTPDTAGTYYLKMEPYSGGNMTYACQAVYSLMIFTHQLFLPSLSR
jgi:hypothetical protein